MNEFKLHGHKGRTLLRKFVPGEDMTGIEITQDIVPDKDLGYIARDPNNEKDQWYVSKALYEATYEPLRESEALIDAGQASNQKTYGNTDTQKAQDSVPDLQIWGDPNLMKLIGKASSQKEQWMKSTKAMEIEGVGVAVQFTTQQGDRIAEAGVFIPDAHIKEERDVDGNVVLRTIVPS